ncbi:MAG: alcohol dehydrogenase, partial [Verrucomicrobia bacterium]|nr:alcohol dehydrogenase [Verrucomicrobiota bacterium]
METVRKLFCGFVFSSVVFGGAALAGDWQHYRGPSGNGIASESCKIPTSGTAPVLWRVKVGTGTSSAVVGGGRLYTMGHQDASDVVSCLDAETGAVVWTFKYPVSLDANMFEGGPRSTPTLSGDCVYTLGHEGQLYCLEAVSGAVRWQRHLAKEFGGRKPSWGYSGAPLVTGGRLFVDAGAVGGSTLALDAKTGELVWKTGSDIAGYAAPLILALEGRPTLVLFKAQAIVGYSPEDGRELWRHPWRTDYNVNAATPLQVGPNRVLISSGYNQGAAMLAVEGGRVSEVWRNKNLRCHINS